jgi:hypothetical protein
MKLSGSLKFINNSTYLGSVALKTKGYVEGKRIGS